MDGNDGTMQSQEVFDQYATDYQNKFLDNPLGIYQRSIVHQLIRPYLTSDKKILDIGCGPGADFEFYKSLSLSIDAIDISREMVRSARQKASKLGLKCRIARSSLEDFLADTTYNFILLNFGVVNAFKNVEIALKKIHELLKPSGYVCMVTMPPVHLSWINENILRGHFKQVYQRIAKKEAELDNGYTFHYLSLQDFAPYFALVNKRNLCGLLPSPDQYSHFRSARLWTRIFIRFDNFMSTRLPDFAGGDHIFYLLQKRKLNPA